MVRFEAAAFLLVVSLICFGCAAGGPEDAIGAWSLVELDGQVLVLGQNTDEVPWVEVEEHRIRGNLGCNFGGGEIEVSGRNVKTEWWSELAGCMSANPEDDPMWAELTLLDLVRSTDGFELIVRGDTMTWRTSDHEAIFESGAP